MTSTFRLRCAPLLFVLSLLTACSRREEHVRAARNFISQWNYDRALTEILPFRSKRDAEIQYLLGICYLKKNEYREALNYFRSSLAAESSYADSIVCVYSLLAKNAMAINDLALALQHYQDLGRLVPRNDQSNNLFLIGDINFDQQNFMAAIEAYTRGLELDSSSRRARAIHPKLIKALINCDQLDSALSLAERDYQRLKIAENLLTMSEIKFEIGQRLFAAADFDSAQIYFQSIVNQQEPKSLLDDSYYYLGEIYYHQDSLAAALVAYQKALNLNPYQKGEVVKKVQDRIREIKSGKGAKP